MNGATAQRRITQSTYGFGIDYALRSLFFGRRDAEPHLRQVVARIALRALHFMQTFTLRSLASASGNLMYE